jgi:hypothetical protein
VENKDDKLKKKIHSKILFTLRLRCVIDRWINLAALRSTCSSHCETKRTQGYKGSVIKHKPQHFWKDKIVIIVWDERFTLL